MTTRNALPRELVRNVGLSAPLGTGNMAKSSPEEMTVNGAPAGRLIVNADDWGRDRETTDRTLDCILRRTLSSVSAMVYMADSERAAVIAQEQTIDAGLHLNFTSPFTSANCPEGVARHQSRIVAYLGAHSFARIFYHPGLANSFEYVVKAQLDEYRRLHGADPERFDGHHHMHLCANVLIGRLMPFGSVVRRNFSFRPGEKSLLNRLYRRSLDRVLARRYRLTDFLFSLPPLEPPARLERIFSLAREFVVEVETHPANPDEYRFLTEGEILRRVGAGEIAPRYVGRFNAGPRLGFQLFDKDRTCSEHGTGHCGK